MNEKTQAIILKNNDYRESDGLLCVLSKEYGKLSFVAKGIMKINSKNNAACMPFGISEFIIDYVDNKSMYTIKGANIVKINRHISEDLELVALASIISEIVDKTLFNDASDVDLNEAYFEITSFALNKLDNKNNPYLAACLFIAYVLDFIGINPTVDECVNCGDTRVSAISIESGGFVCSNCARQVKTVSASVDGLKKFRYVNKAKMENYDALSASYKYDKNDLVLLLEFLELHSGIELKSKGLLSSI